MTFDIRMSDYELMHVKHPSNVYALPCKMQNSFIGAKLGFKSAGCYIVSYANLKFMQAPSQEDS